jgi:hypothetical protein
MLGKRVEKRMRRTTVSCILGTSMNVKAERSTKLMIKIVALGMNLTE